MTCVVKCNTYPPPRRCSPSHAATLDRFDRPLTVNDPAGATDFSWSYPADGRPAMVSCLDGNHTDLTYDALGRLTGSDTDAAGCAPR